MITRRSFLIGAASSFTLPMFEKFTTFFENHGEPLIEAPEKAGDILYVYPDRDFQMGLNGDPWEPDYPMMTWREMLVEERGYENPTKLSHFRKIRWEWNVSPSMIDEVIPEDFWYEAFERRGPHADAHWLLKGLDIGPNLEMDGQVVGGLQFIDGPMPGNNYLAVHADDEISVSLLQHRLNELKTGVAIELSS